MNDYKPGTIVQDRCHCGNPELPHVRYRIDAPVLEGRAGVLLRNLATDRHHRTSTTQLAAGYDVVVNVDTGELAPRPERLPRTGVAEQSLHQLGAANRQRCADAAPRVCAEVRRALDALGARANPNDAQAGRLRLEHPHATLAELAALARPPLTKDAVAGRLRRLLAAARHERP